MKLTNFLSYKTNYFYIKENNSYTLNDYISKESIDLSNEFKHHNLLIDIIMSNNLLLEIKTNLGTFIIPSSVTTDQVSRLFKDSFNQGEGAYYLSHRVSDCYQICIAKDGEILRHINYDTENDFVYGEYIEYEKKLGITINEDNLFDIVSEDLFFDYMKSYLGFDVYEEDFNIIESNLYKFKDIDDFTKYILDIDYLNKIKDNCLKYNVSKLNLFFYTNNTSKIDVIIMCDNIMVTAWSTVLLDDKEKNILCLISKIFNELQNIDLTKPIDSSMFSYYKPGFLNPYNLVLGSFETNSINTCTLILVNKKGKKLSDNKRNESIRYTNLDNIENITIISDYLINKLV